MYCMFANLFIQQTEFIINNQVPIFAKSTTFCVLSISSRYRYSKSSKVGTLGICQVDFKSCILRKITVFTTLTAFLYWTAVVTSKPTRLRPDTHPLQKRQTHVICFRKNKIASHPRTRIAQNSSKVDSSHFRSIQYPNSINKPTNYINKSVIGLQHSSEHS